MADLENKKANSEASVEKKSESKKNKVSFFKNIGKFFKECKSELKKIVWFSRKQTFSSTVLVIVAIVVSALFIGLFDFAFSNALKFLAGLI